MIVLNKKTPCKLLAQSAKCVLFGCKHPTKIVFNIMLHPKKNCKTFVQKFTINLRRA
mgnify:CR=1 FL=1